MGRERSHRSTGARRSTRRRRHLLVFLVATAIATAGISLWQGGSWRELHLIADGILIFYVAMLFESKRRRDERTTKVRSLEDQRPEDVRILDHVEAGGHRF